MAVGKTVEAVGNRTWKMCPPGLLRTHLKCHMRASMHPYIMYVHPSKFVTLRQSQSLLAKRLVQRDRTRRRRVE